MSDHPALQDLPYERLDVNGDGEVTAEDLRMLKARLDDRRDNDKPDEPRN